MLCVTRKRGDTVTIGDGIAVVVIDVGGGKVKLGIQAPPDVPILRGELGPVDRERFAARAAGREGR
jgi:carbon storage regulator